MKLKKGKYSNVNNHLHTFHAIELELLDNCINDYNLTAFGCIWR